MAEYAIGAATAGVKILAQWVAARAMDEINLGWGFKNELQKLHKKFEYIQAFLDDASNAKYANKSQLVNLWMQKVKDAAYAADDVMDEYAIEIFRRKMVRKNPLEEFDNWSTPSSAAIFHLQMAHKVKEILSLFDEIDKEAKNIGLNQVDIASPSVGQSNNDVDLSTNTEYVAPKVSEFMERKDDQDKLLDAICNPGNYEESSLSTVAIVGMGGVGKTTLTRYLYEHERIRANFGDKKILIICGESESFEITGLLNQMVESVTSDESKLSNRDAIIGKLGKNLEGKKLLLVFDDVWNDKQDSWRCLEGWLNKIGTLPGSVMLINTRSDEVAKAAGAVFKLKLEGLSADQSWSLLQKIVSNNNTQPINPSMEEVGRRIVEKCKGVPLAIRVIAGLLQSKCDLDEWASIEKSNIWDTAYCRRLILPTLLPSFNHLPSPSIKQCFAYCAIIPRGNYLFKSELISLWSSQGYLRDDTRKNMTAEEIGEENLNILLSNSLLKCVKTNYGILGYLMHELVYDLAVYVCGSDLIKEAQDLHEIGSCRHLVFESLENGSEIAFTPENALTKLRTLSLKGNDIPLNILIHSRYLRTLKLDRTGITELPSSVMLLKHLRFLDLSYNPISTLPDLITELYQLQTLILKGCGNMKMLPEVLYKLVNLRHVLTTSPMLAWRGLQQLTYSQNSSSLSLDNDEDRWMGDDYEDLHQLKDTIQCVNDDIKACKVTELNFLWAKQIRETGEGISDEDELEALEPHPNITSLEVENFTGVRFPKWIMAMAVLTEGVTASLTQLNDLTTIKLLNCSRCQTLPKLGQLPHLKCLVLSEFYVEIMGIEFYGGDDLAIPEVVSFNSLQELEVSGFRRLTTWREAPKAAFPSLETLRIKDCSLLESLPASEFKSLMTLELENLNSVESIDIIKYSFGLISLTMDGLPKIGSLPQELANCTKLQTLHISNFQKLGSLPSGLESLIDLQSLRLTNDAAMNFVTDDVVHIRTFLRTFQSVDCPGLRTIQNLPSLLLHDDEDRWTRDDFGDLQQLGDEVYVLALECKLNFLWVKETGETSEAICDEDELEALEPYPNIRSLEVQNFTCVRFPKWITDMAVSTGVKASRTQLNNLTTIKLLNCSRCQTLPKLGQLPYLKCLVLSEFYVEIIGIEFYGGDNLAMPEVVSFNSLQELEVSGFRRLTTWREAPKAAFPRLETLRIKDCSLLESLPVSEFKSLMTLELENLNSVEAQEPPPSITSLEVQSFTGERFPKWINWTQLNNLHTVKLFNCSRCKTLPKLGQLPLLKFLALSGLDVESIGSNFYGGNNDLGPRSWHAKIFGMPEMVSFKSLQELEISGFRRLATWRQPPKAAFPSLETLRIKDCSLLETVPAFEFKSLTDLELSDLHSLESVDIIKYNSGLTSIIMNGLLKIGSLPQELTNCSQLQTLHISSFRKLASLPTGLEALVNLQSLKVAHCSVLNFIMDDILHIRSSLGNLEIINCPNLGTIPSSLEECIMLKTLSIKECPMIMGSFTNMSKLKRLLKLRMSFRSVEQLRCVLESAKDLPLLRILEIDGFRNEKEMKDYFSDMTPFLNLPSLTELMLCGHPNIKTLPEQLGMLTRITALYIWHFDDLEESPSWICNLTSLRCLIFEDCKNLKGLPSKQDMLCLIYLGIAKCPLLERRYAKDGGSEWDTISHIRQIKSMAR